jgi:hypothetical protein
MGLSLPPLLSHKMCFHNIPAEVPQLLKQEFVCGKYTATHNKAKLSTESINLSTFNGVVCHKSANVSAFAD